MTNEQEELTTKNRETENLIRDYEMITEKKRAALGIRNNLLTFSFTAVLAVIGVAFAQEGEVNPIILLLPYCLIVPFTARITYYRIQSAYYDGFLKAHSSSLSVFSGLTGKDGVSDLGGVNKITGWMIGKLMNFEMLVLSIACAVLFYVSYSVEMQDFSMRDWVMNSLPIIFSLLVFAIILTGLDYRKIKDRYEKEWSNHKFKDAKHNPSVKMEKSHDEVEDES